MNRALKKAASEEVAFLYDVYDVMKCSYYQDGQYVNKSTASNAPKFKLRDM